MYNKNSVIFVVLLFISCNVQAFYFDVGLKIQFTDSVIIFGAVYFALYFLKGNNIKKYPSLIYMGPLLCYLIFLFWSGISALISTYPEKAVTLFLQIARNFILLILFTKIPMTLEDFRRINLYVFVSGVVFSIIALMLYYFRFLNFQDIVFRGDGWAGLGYELDRTGYLRLNGLVGDSNFFSLYMTLPLLCGLNLKTRKSYRYAGIILIMISIILAFSRTMYVLICSYFCIMVVIGRVRLNLSKIYSLLKIVMSIIVVILVVMNLFDINPVKAMKIRFEGMYSGMRIASWHSLYDMLSGNRVIFGYGLRSSQNALGGYYSHNTYLETLIDAGIIGLLLFISIPLTSYLVLMKKKGVRGALEAHLPWNHMFAILMAFMVPFSFGTNPFLWFVIGMVILSYKPQGDRNEGYFTAGQRDHRFERAPC